MEMILKFYSVLRTIYVESRNVDAETKTRAGMEIKG